MKEEDLDKVLDTIIIDGLIKETEQEGADFAAAIRNLSDEEFEAIIMEPAMMEEYDGEECSPIYMSKNMSYSMSEEPACCYADADSRAPEPEPVVAEGKTGKRSLRPWIVAALIAVAVMLIALLLKKF